MHTDLHTPPFFPPQKANRRLGAKMNQEVNHMAEDMEIGIRMLYFAVFIA